MCATKYSAYAGKDVGHDTGDFCELGEVVRGLARSEGVQAERSSAPALCGMWIVNPNNALGVEYVFGVVKGEVVSAYRVLVPSSQWPLIPAPSAEKGRRFIPGTAVSEKDWLRATGWDSVSMYGPIRYGKVEVDNVGVLSGYSFPNTPPHPEETESNEGEA